MSCPLSYFIEDQKLKAHLTWLASEKGLYRPSPEWISRQMEHAARRFFGLENSDVSPKEVCRILGISDRTFRNMKARGDFPNAYYINQRVIRIPMSDLEALKERTVTVAA